MVTPLSIVQSAVFSAFRTYVTVLPKEAIRVAALQPAIGTARVVISGTFVSVPAVNVIHVSKTPINSAFTQADINTIATGVRAQFVTSFIPLMSTSYSLGTVTATDLSSDLGVVGSASGSTPGTLVGAALPANVALCVSWKTAVHFRGGHCRNYFCGLTTSDTTNPNTWLGTRVTAWDTAAGTFLTGISSLGTSAPVQMVMLSRVRTAAGASVPTTLVPPLAYPITGHQVDTRIDSMRRRLGKDR